MTIREATESDIAALVEMGEDFHSSTPYGFVLSNNPTQYRVICERFMADPAAVLLVADVDGQAVGMLGALIFNHPLSGERTVGELFWWSDPKHRGSTGVRLLKAAEAWAVEQGASQIAMIQPAWADRVGELYDALGYQRIEVAWHKRLVSA